MNDEILKRAIDTFGVEAQLNIVIEECSELIKEICKMKRGKYNRLRMAEEIADVEIMIRHLELMFGIDTQDCTDDSVEVLIVINALSVLINLCVLKLSRSEVPYALADNYMYYINILKNSLKKLKTQLSMYPLVNLYKLKKIERLEQLINNHLEKRGEQMDFCEIPNDLFDILAEHQLEEIEKELND